jgi:hypothetical protein
MRRRKTRVSFFESKTPGWLIRISGHCKRDSGKLGGNLPEKLPNVFDLSLDKALDTFRGRNAEWMYLPQ